MEEMVLAVADMTLGSRHTVLGVATRAILIFIYMFRNFTPPFVYLPSPSLV
jgi:hypothetical protein